MLTVAIEIRRTHGFLIKNIIYKQYHKTFPSFFLNFFSLYFFGFDIDNRHSVLVLDVDYFVCVNTRRASHVSGAHLCLRRDRARRLVDEPPKWVGCGEL